MREVGLVDSLEFAIGGCTWRRKAANMRIILYYLEAALANMRTVVWRVEALDSLDMH